MPAPVNSATPALLTPAQTRICLQVLNIYETGSPLGKYDVISIFHDGPGGIRQITYGAKQTTEYGNLAKLTAMYIAANGRFAAEFTPFQARIGVTSLTDNAAFKDLLVKAAQQDPVMVATQDAFFDKVYFQPAKDWARKNGFRRALSVLVIFDSFIHSGSIPSFLRKRFPEMTPAAGGREEVWIRQYTEARHQWLGTHSNLILRKTIYRTRDLLREITAGNWDLAQLPFVANGTKINEPGPVAPPPPEEWSEIEPAELPPVTPPAVSSLADLAARILASPKITLATAHVSGVQDDATARQNMLDVSQGRPARRSAYGNAPGGSIPVDAGMLKAILTLSETWSFHVSEVCGGSHSPTSRHYAGVAFDVSVIDGVHVGPTHPKQAAFRQKCQALGGTEVLGPGVAHHSTHIHAAWPRP